MNRSRIVTTAVGSALAAGLSTALVDIMLTLRRAHDASDAWEVGLVVLGLHAAFALLVGLAESMTVIALLGAGAFDTWRSLQRRLVSDERFDHEVAGALMASCVAAAAFAVWVGSLTWHLVASSHRLHLAIRVSGALATASLPVFFLVAFLLRRVAARIARVLPRPRRLTATGVSCVFAAMTPATGGVLLARHFDWREMPLGAPIALALFLFVQAVFAVVLLTRSTARWHRPLVGSAALLAAALVPLALGRSPANGARVLLFDETYGGRPLAQAAQRLFDRDHDGYSTLLGGGDCDDGDPEVHPGAQDIPDDGIDQNCLGGDAHVTPPSAPRSPAPEGFHFRGNIVFVFIDTLRADKLDARLMPNLHALARRGVRFRHVWAQSPRTFDSFPSLVCSRLPSAIAWDKTSHGFPGMRLENRTMFEALHDAGYYTAGVASHLYFDTAGVTQGFDEFDNAGAPAAGEGDEDVSAPRIIKAVERILPRLATNGPPFALLIHFTEPHAYYVPHPEVRRGRPAPSGREAAYEEEVQYLDDQLGGLLARFGENTMFVVFSDHGEGFGLHREHGKAMFNHGNTLYEDLLRVPLLIVAPGMTPLEVTQPVMLMDVAPTVLDVVGAPVPSTFSGRSLAGALAGAPLAPAPSYAELLPVPSWDFSARALLDVDGRTKLLYRITEPRFELYDVSSDPEEKHYLGTGHAEEMTRMQRAMSDWLDSP